MSCDVVAPYPYCSANSSESHAGMPSSLSSKLLLMPEVSCGVYSKPSSCMQAATISSERAIWASISASSCEPPSFSQYAASGLSSYVSVASSDGPPPEVQPARRARATAPVAIAVVIGVVLIVAGPFGGGVTGRSHWGRPGRYRAEIGTKIIPAG